MGLYQWLLSQGSSASRLARCVSSSSRLPHLEAAAGIPGAEGNPLQRTGTFQTSAGVPFTTISLVRASHVTKPSVRVEKQAPPLHGRSWHRTQVPGCRSGVNRQTSLGTTTWTVYKLGICVRLCNTELLSITLTSFLEEFPETKST